MSTDPTNGSPYLATILPWAQLRELHQDPATPANTLPALRKAMDYQEAISGLMDHRTQVEAIREKLDYREITRALVDLHGGPVHEALMEAKTGIELARTEFSSEVHILALQRGLD